MNKKVLLITIVFFIQMISSNSLEDYEQIYDFCGDRICGSLENADNCVFDCGEHEIHFFINKDELNKKLYIQLDGEGVSQISFEKIDINIIKDNIKISQANLIISEEGSYKGEYDISRLNPGTYQIFSPSLIIYGEFVIEKSVTPSFSVKPILMPPAIIKEKDVCSIKSDYEQPLGAVLNIEIKDLKTEDIIELKNINTWDIIILEHNKLSVSFVENPRYQQQIKASLGDLFLLSYRTSSKTFSRYIKITEASLDDEFISQKIIKKRSAIIEFLYNFGELFTKPFREFFGLFVSKKELTKEGKIIKKELSSQELQYSIDKMKKESEEVIDKYEKVK